MWSCPIEDMHKMLRDVGSCLRDTLASKKDYDAN